MSKEDICHWPKCKLPSEIIYKCIDDIEFNLCDKHWDKLLSISYKEKEKVIRENKRRK